MSRSITIHEQEANPHGVLLGPQPRSWAEFQGGKSSAQHPTIHINPGASPSLAQDGAAATVRGSSVPSTRDHAGTPPTWTRVVQPPPFAAPRPASSAAVPPPPSAPHPLAPARGRQAIPCQLPAVAVQKPRCPGLLPGAGLWIRHCLASNLLSCSR